MVSLLLALLLSQPGLVEALSKGTPTFNARERTVSGWRVEAALHLDASTGTRALLLLGIDPRPVTRCVRLNNYWCIKRGGWAGEIAADVQGHVAFASALEGATTAALLLRRYYVDYGRRSALAIVSRWAPASCGASAPSTRRFASRAAPDGLAKRGIGMTLRARWLARRGHRVAGAGRVRKSSVADRLIGTGLPSPTIAVGLGTAPPALSAGLPETLLSAAPAIRTMSPSQAACVGDAPRIANYAAKAAAGLAPTTGADLGLFDRDDMPTPHLAKLLRNMASVEIGPLGADAGLIEDAIARAVAAVAARRRPPAPATDRRIDARRTEPQP